jgi:Immunity protein 21
VRWISSTGGPLVAVPAKSAALWQGHDLASGHHELACAIEEVAVVAFRAGWEEETAFVLWDEPLATAYDSGTCTILQWRQADTGSDLLALAGSAGAIGGLGGRRSG